MKRGRHLLFWTTHAKRTLIIFTQIMHTIELGSQVLQPATVSVRCYISAGRAPSSILPRPLARLVLFYLSCRRPLLSPFVVNRSFCLSLCQSLSVPLACSRCLFLPAAPRCRPRALQLFCAEWAQKVVSLVEQNEQRQKSFSARLPSVVAQRDFQFDSEPLAQLN